VVVVPGTTLDEGGRITLGVVVIVVPLPHAAQADGLATAAGAYVIDG
jgi:hypothetical protein